MTVEQFYALSVNARRKAVTLAYERGAFNHHPRPKLSMLNIRDGSRMESGAYYMAACEIAPHVNADEVGGAA